MPFSTEEILTMKMSGWRTTVHTESTSAFHRPVMFSPQRSLFMYTCDRRDTLTNLWTCIYSIVMLIRKYMEFMRVLALKMNVRDGWKRMEMWEWGKRAIFSLTRTRYVNISTARLVWMIYSALSCRCFLQALFSSPRIFFQLSLCTVSPYVCHGSGSLGFSNWYSFDSNLKGQPKFYLAIRYEHKIKEVPLSV